MACEAAAEMHIILTGIENKLRAQHPGLELGKSLPEFVLSNTIKKWLTRR